MSTIAPAPSPNKHALISTPGSSSRYMAALQISTQIDNTRSARPPAISTIAGWQVRKRGAATLSHQVERENVGWQAESLGEVARQPGHNTRCTC